LFKGIQMLESYIPYMAGGKLFENKQSNELIARYTRYGPAPALQDYIDKEGQRHEGYFPLLLHDTLETRWGGLLDRLQDKNKKTAPGQN